MVLSCICHDLLPLNMSVYNYRTRIFPYITIAQLTNLKKLTLLEYICLIQIIYQFYQLFSLSFFLLVFSSFLFRIQFRDGCYLSFLIFSNLTVSQPLLFMTLIVLENTGRVENVPYDGSPWLASCYIPGWNTTGMVSVLRELDHKLYISISLMMLIMITQWRCSISLVIWLLYSPLQVKSSLGQTLWDHTHILLYHTGTPRFKDGS